MLVANDELVTRGWNALVEKLGVTEATRFLLQYQRGTGDYTKDRQKYLQKMTLQQLVADIKEKYGK